MKIIYITGNLCIFDTDADTNSLSVLTDYTNCPEGYKKLVYSSGLHKGKKYCRVLMSAKEGELVDHKNGNTLDNRKLNLRLATVQQNQFNRKKAKNKSGLPKGVCKHGSSYRAMITYNYTQYSLGTFLTPEEAEAAYIKKANEFYGDRALHNSRKSNG